MLLKCYIYSKVIKNIGEITITYSSITSKDMNVHDITLELKIIHKNGTLHFSAKMVNNSSVRINELQYPGLLSMPWMGIQSNDKYLYIG